MPKQGGMDFLRKIDRYADPVQLYINQRKTMPTPSGGFLSLITFLILCFWMAQNILDEIKSEYSFSSYITDV